jgi:hypothetical protein
LTLDKNLPDEKKAERLAAELRRLRDERRPFEADWSEAQELVASVALSFDADADAATKGYNTPKRITNRPSQYQETLVSGICGYGVNPNIVWAKLGLADQGAAKRHGVKDWLEEVEQAQYEEYDNANLYPQMKIVIDQATIYGYGLMHVGEDIEGCRAQFTQINVPEAYLDTNEHNEYETVFRHFYMTNENAASRFRLEKMHESFREQWGREGNDAWRAKGIELLHAVFRRKDASGASELNTEMPWASFWVDLANKHVIEESGYRTFPYAIFAWERVGGLKYPISPAIKAVNDIKLLHKSEGTRLTLAQMAAKQPVAVPEAMRGAVEMFGEDGYIRPGAIIYYDGQAGDQVPSGLQMGSNYPITLDITRDQAATIKDWFFVDFFLMLQQQNLGNITATAIQALQGEKAATMTNMITNLKRALQVVVQRTYDIMARQGRLPDLPAALIGQGGGRMRFTFASVLSQIQQAALRYQGAARFLPTAQAVATLGQAYPPALEALDRFDFDAILQNEARGAHLAETAIREDKDVEAMRQARAQAQQAQQQQVVAAQERQSLAQNYNKLNEPLVPGSPAAALLGQGG